MSRQLPAHPPSGVVVLQTGVVQRPRLLPVSRGFAVPELYPDSCLHILLVVLQYCSIADCRRSAARTPTSEPRLGPTIPELYPDSCLHILLVVL
jgi:hypothetical protein